MVNEGKVMEEAKAKALQAALAQIEKQFGKGAAGWSRSTGRSPRERRPSRFR